MGTYNSLYEVYSSGSPECTKDYPIYESEYDDEGRLEVPDFVKPFVREKDEVHIDWDDNPKLYESINCKDWEEFFYERNCSATVEGDEVVIYDVNDKIIKRLPKSEIKFKINHIEYIQVKELTFIKKITYPEYEATEYFDEHYPNGIWDIEGLIDIMNKFVHEDNKEQFKVGFIDKFIKGKTFFILS